MTEGLSAALHPEPISRMTLKNGTCFPHPLLHPIKLLFSVNFKLIRTWIDSFPASAAFDVISDSLSSSEAERKDVIQKGKAIFGFTLKNKEGQEDSWYIDLKDTGSVSKTAPKKVDGMNTFGVQVLSRFSAMAGRADYLGIVVTLTLSDDNFGKLVTGKANAQKLFMSGQLKIKGTRRSFRPNAKAENDT